MREDTLHKGVVQMLRYLRPDCLWFHVPNQGNFPVQYRKKLADMGLRPGVADLVFINGDQTAFIELKTPTGRQSQAQKAFQAECEQQGIPYFVIQTDDLNDANAKLMGTLKGLGIVK